MTDFPRGMRMAGPGDEGRLFDLFAVAHGENGFGTMDPQIVRDVIAKGCHREGAAIALIDGPERVEAVIGLRAEKLWYCSDDAANWYWSDLLIYVHPLHRRSRHAPKLFQFARWWGERIAMPVVLGLMPREGLPQKDRMFERHGRRVGALFAIGLPTEGAPH